MVVGAMTLLSRLLGFARDIVIAMLFGSSLGADAFFVAFRLPNLLRRLFAEGVFAQSFVPVLTERKNQDSELNLKCFVDQIAGALVLFLSILTVVAMLATPALVMVFAPGFSAEATQFALTVQMFRIMAPYLLLIGMTALAGSILNSYGSFAPPAFTPVFLNIAIISAALWLGPYLQEPVTALAWGVVGGGLLQLLFQIPFLLSLGMLPWPRWNFSDPGLRQVLQRIGPAVFGVSAVQINLLINTLIASFMISGSVSWLYYSDRLVEFPLGVFGVALATVILPALTQEHIRGSGETFSQILDWALRWVLMMGLPATLALMVLAGPTMATLFHHGAFADYDVQMASRSLMAFASGLLALILIKVLANGFYSRQDTNTPVRISAVVLGANILVGLCLIKPLAHAGLALATSLSAYLNAGLLWFGLKRAGVYRSQPGWREFLLRLGFANGIMTLVLWYGPGELADWLTLTGMARAGRLISWILVGLGVYLAALGLSGLRWRHMLLVRPVTEPG